MQNEDDFHIPEEEFKKDLKKFSHDCEDLLEKESLYENSDFLNEFAEDIKKLNDDTLLLIDEKDFKNSADIIQHILTTPWGAPFVSNKTLLEAAIAYEYQDPLQSDLHNLVGQFTHFSEHVHNPIVTVVHSLSERLEREKNE